MNTWDKEKVDGGVKYKVYFTSLMDLNNNNMGVEYAYIYSQSTPEEVFQRALQDNSLITSLDDVPKFYNLSDDQIH